MPERLTWHCNQHGDEPSIRQRAALHLLAGTERSRQRLALVPQVARQLCQAWPPASAHTSQQLARMSFSKV
jgi:hypothetical protein